VPLLIAIMCMQIVSAQKKKMKEDENVFGKYQITVLDSPRGDTKATLKIWKNDDGEVEAEFVENGKKMLADKVEITGSEIYIERYSEQVMYNEEWDLKVEGDKISGYGNSEFRVTGYRIK